MFDSIPLAPPDAILGLGEAFKKDTNPNKINLSVGVYKDAQGNTPVLASVKEAEKRLLDGEKSKTYLSIEGLPDYGKYVQELLFGGGHPVVAEGRAVTAQTPGGTGALRVAADFLKKHLPGTKVWLSKPTWANHAAIFQSAGLPTENYDYIDSTGKTLDFAAMMSSLSAAKPGDVILLHACCHNPTGIDPKREDWMRLANWMSSAKVLPLVDFAYQGFGVGLEEDAFGLREVAKHNPELMVCSSFSKNFGLYSERVGALTLVAKKTDEADKSLSQIRTAIRVNYSNPPQHGAAIVAKILGDANLRKQWEQELAAMRTRIHEMRTLFVQSMKTRKPHRDFSFIAEQQGMFSFSGLTPMQVDQLKTQYGIYIVSAGGRMNVAGMTADNMPRLCDAIATVL